MLSHLSSEENKKRKLESKKGKPYLEVKITVPPNMVAGRSYQAEVKITNKGLVPAKNIQIKVTSTPGLTLYKELAEIDELKPFKEEKKPLFITFPFRQAIKSRKVFIKFVLIR